MNVDQEQVPENIEGNAVEIVSIGEDRKVRLNAEGLERIFNNPQIDDELPVVVLAVAGAARTGKSFLLSLLLLYLKSGCTNLDINGTTFTGFEWAKGTKSITNGIRMWSKPFVMTTNKQKVENKNRNYANIKMVAIYLVDTQGTSVIGSSLNDTVGIFCLCSLFSSVLVFNIPKSVQENNLQELQYFSNYGTHFLENSEEVKPYQNLVFLIRDWIHTEEHTYGIQGGKVYLEKVLMVDERQSSECQDLRRNVNSFYDNISCFLMPHPGRKVETENIRDGKFPDMDPEFVSNVEHLARILLHPDNLTVKSVANGNIVRVKELQTMIRTYVNIFEGDTLPEPRTLFQASVDLNIETAKNKAVEFYNEEIEKKSTNENIGINELNEVNTTLRTQTIQKFRSDVHNFLSEPCVDNHLNQINQHMDYHFAGIISRKKAEDALKDAAKQKADMERGRFFDRTITALGAATFTAAGSKIFSNVPTISVGKQEAEITTRALAAATTAVVRQTTGVITGAFGKTAEGVIGNGAASMVSKAAEATMTSSAAEVGEKIGDSLATVATNSAEAAIGAGAAAAATTTAAVGGAVVIGAILVSAMKIYLNNNN